jgi:hypothetical protein
MKSIAQEGVLEVSTEASGLIGAKETETKATASDVGREKGGKPAPARGNLTQKVNSRARARARTRECENPPEFPHSRAVLGEQCGQRE